MVITRMLPSLTLTGSDLTSIFMVNKDAASIMVLFG